MNNKLNLSIGILTWNSNELDDTLQTYKDNGLFDMVDDVTILFQQASTFDIQLQSKWKINSILETNNIGIGKAFIKLTENAKYDNVLVLEHDWKLIEGKDITYKRLSEGISILDDGYDVIRYRHRQEPGNPHFSFRHKGMELNYFDSEIGYNSPHLLDSIHWLEADKEFPNHIKKQGEWFLTTSRWGNWTNNPCMYKKQFYLDKVTPFVGEGIDLEGKISKWWCEQNYYVAHGEGLFKHLDRSKY